MIFADWITDTSELLKALAAVGWVAIAGAVLIVFRRDIRGLFHRVRRVDTVMGSAELDPEVQQLVEGANDSSAEIFRQAPQIDYANLKGPNDEDDLPEDARLAVIMIVPKIDERVKDLASIAGFSGNKNLPWSVRLNWLVKNGVVPASVASSGDLIRSVRNRIVHGGIEDIDDREVAASLNAGVLLLRALDAIPRHGYEVVTNLLPVFHDAEATSTFEDCSGVLLRSFDATGKGQEAHIYPTRKAYSPGLRVGWQWSFDQTWGPAYWKDPFDEHRIKEAWGESAEFVGEALILQPNAREDLTKI